jgi:hypothetical protein
MTRLPAEADTARFWTLLDDAWAAVGGSADAARHALLTATADDREDLAVEVDSECDAMLDALADRCAEMTADELTDLDRVVERLLHDIDRADIQAVTDGSDDGFLYARGFVVAVGREFYRAVAADPTVAVLDAECGRICYHFAHLHADRFGDFPSTGSGISRESGSNAAGWR